MLRTTLPLMLLLFISFVLPSKAICQVGEAAQQGVRGVPAPPPIGESTPEEAAWTVLVGQVLGPDGAPAAGAVVVTSAGGQAVTAPDGAFSLEVALPPEAESVRVTAVLGAGTGGLIGSAQIDGLTCWGTTVAGALILQQAGTCQPSWLPTFGQAVYPEGGIESGSTSSVQINSFAVFDDGSGPALYVGGEFHVIGGVTSPYIARWNGLIWSTVGGGTNYWVYALAVFDDGSGPALYAGGLFSSAGGVSAYSIAKWNGSSWSALGSGTNGIVYALTVFDDGTGPALFAGGYFTFAGGVAAKCIAKWNGSNWSALGSGLTDPINTHEWTPNLRALCVFDDGSGPALYAGGDFNTAGGVTANNIAKWNGSNWSALSSGMTTFNDEFSGVFSLETFDDGNGPAMYAGGSFDYAGGIPVGNIAIAKWRGSGWSALTQDPFVSPVTFVHDLTVFNDGSGASLYVAGNGVYKWTGSAWSELNEITYGALSLGVFDDGSGPTLYVGTYEYGYDWPTILKWAGTTWSTLSNGLSDSVAALAVFDDGTGPALYAGGNFLHVGGILDNVYHVARWNGVTWSALGGVNGPASSTDYNTSVTALTVFDDGSGPALYVAGTFYGIFNRIAKWNGSTWSKLANGLNGEVAALAVFDDGSGPALYAGGSFTSAVGGVAANRIAKWNGMNWSNLGSGLNNPVASMAVFDAGSGPALYVGGSFTNAGGGVANRIARWNGSTWSALANGVNGTVSALTVFHDGSSAALYAGGSFTSANGGVANRIAKWNGANWSPLGSGMNLSVLSLAGFDDGSGSALFAGGIFTVAGGVVAKCIAKWNGTTWSPLGNGVAGGPSAGGTSSVLALTVFDGGNGPGLYAGGDFGSAIDSLDSYLAKWGGCSTTAWSNLGLALPGATGVPLLVGTGDLVAGSAGTLALSNAAPSALSLLLISLSSTPVPFKCGTLVPFPIAINLSLATGPTGALLLPWAAWPAGLSGLSLYWQYVIQDATAVCGASLSNALRANVP